MFVSRSISIGSRVGLTACVSAAAAHDRTGRRRLQTQVSQPSRFLEIGLQKRTNGVFQDPELHVHPRVAKELDTVPIVSCIGVDDADENGSDPAIYDRLRTRGSSTNEGAWFESDKHCKTTGVWSQPEGGDGGGFGMGFTWGASEAARENPAFVSDDTSDRRIWSTHGQRLAALGKRGRHKLRLRFSREGHHIESG